MTGEVERQNGVIRAMNKTNKRSLIAAYVTTGLCVCGGLTTSGCSEEEVSAVLAGVQIIAGELVTSDDGDDDISFGDWLASELRN